MNATERTPFAAADYLATLGLQQAPYLDSTDARFFYADPGLIQRLDLLQHLTQFGDMLLGVTGPVGSGKTSLAQQFLQRGNTAWRSCRLNGAHIQHPDELLAKLTECFGLQTSATPERIRAELVRHCQTLRHNAQLAVLVIDDAQQLSDPALKTLLELADDPRETLKLLRVVLFSEAGLEQRLTAAGWHSPQQPFLHNLDIPPFDEQQTAAYLMYRLAVAGYSGESPFSLTEIRALHKAADGLPGKLNVLAHETLMERAGRLATRKKATATGSRRIQPVMALGLLGSLIVGGLAWWYASQNQTAEEPIAPPASAPSGEPADNTPVPPVEPAAPAPIEPPAEESVKSLETTPKTQQPTDIKEKNPDEPAPAPTQPTTSAPAETVEKDSPSADLARPKSAPAPSDTPASAAPMPPAAAPTTNVPVPKTAPPTPLASAPSNPTPPPNELDAPDTAGKPATTDDGKPDPSEKPAAVTAPAATPQPTAPATTPKPSSPVATPPPSQPPTTTAAAEQLGTDWLQSRPGAHFTLQLLGGRSEKSLRDYLRQNHIPEPVATFRTVFKGDDWYVLVHGDFPDSATARAAVATLPPTVRKGKPWARSFVSIHTDMQKTRP